MIFSFSINLSKFLLLCIFFLLTNANADDETIIKVFDVGQGNAIGIKYKYKENGIEYCETMLIDAGSKYCDQSAEKHNNFFSTELSSTEYKDKVINDIRNFMLENNAIVRAVVVTHAHDDHYNLLGKIFEDEEQQGRIENIVLSGYNDFYSSINISGWVDTLKEKVKYTRRKEEGKIYKLTEAGFKKHVCFIDHTNSPKIELLSMNQGINSINRNDDSIVLQILCHKTVSILLTGDATAKTWQGVKLWGDTLSHILLIPHHGSRANMQAKTESGRFFNIFDIIQPEIAIFSSGLYGRYAHPHEDVYERLEEIMAYRGYEPSMISCFNKEKKILQKYTNNSIFSTVDHGTISIKIKGDLKEKESKTKIPFIIELERSEERVLECSNDQGFKMEIQILEHKVPPIKKLKKYEERELIKLDSYTIDASKIEGKVFLVREKGEKYPGYAYSPTGDINSAWYIKILVDDPAVEVSEEEEIKDE